MFIDSNGHEIVFKYDRSKGSVWTRPRRYFGEFAHTDGSPACDGEFREVKENQEKKNG